MNFSSSHPLVLFLYFVVMICFGFINRSPEFLMISFAGAFGYKCLRRKKHKKSYEFIFYIIVVLIFTIVNMIFSHNGEGVLFFVGDNAITKQSAYSGICTGLAVSSGLCWLSSMCEVMSGEKITYLLSGISPKLAMFVSRSMRLLPSAVRQFKSIYRTQKTIYSGTDRKFKKMYVISRSLSAVLTWMIEDSANASDSMYSRGYGLARHSVFNIFQYEKRDLAMLMGLSYIVALISAAIVFDCVGVYFYPVLSHPGISIVYLIALVLWIVLSAIPFISEICEEYKWKLLKSKI